MRKFLSLLTMCLLAVTAIHAETFVMADQTGLPSTNGDFSLTFGTYTMNCLGNNGATKPTYNSNGKDVRLYAKNTAQFTTTGNAMTQIVFTISTAGQKRLAEITASTGSVSIDATAWTVTWTGSATDVTFTVGDYATYGTDGATKAGQLDFTQVDINTGAVAETVAAPAITPAAGTYYSPINVTINCGTQGANVYYTTNGATPTASSTLYSAPFEVSSNTTVKAIAIKGNLQSEVVEAAYEFGTATEVANIAAFLSQAEGTVVKFANPVNVLAQYTLNSGNARLFVKDNSGYMFIFGKVGQKYNNGDVIPAGFTGTKAVYDGGVQLTVTETSNFQAASSNSPIAPEEIQADDVDEDMFAHYVYIAGATLGYTTNSSGSKYLATISDISGQAAAYNSMGASISDWDATYNVTAVVGSHVGKNSAGQDSTIYQVWPVILEKVGGGTQPQDGIATIAEYQALAKDATFTFTGEAVVTYVNGSYNYIKDNTGSALIYQSGLDLNPGDVLASGWTGKKDVFYGLDEIKNVANLSKTGTTQTITPVEYTTTDVTIDNQNVYCVLRGVKIASVSGKNFTFEDGAAGYNQFNDVILPDDLTQAYDIEGVISIHNTAQFVPTRFLADISVPKVADIAALLEKESGATYEIEGDITAIYQKGSRLFVKDADTYMLVYGYMTGDEHTFTNGDIIRGAQASWTTYQDAPQLTPVVSTFVVAEHGTPVQPETMAIEELGTDMVHMYVKLNNVAVVNNTEDARYATATDETSQIQLFNQFGLDMPADGNYNAVIGFVSVYQGAIQVYPVEFVAEGTSYPVGDVDGSGLVDIDDVNAVINIILDKKLPSDYPGNADVDGSGIVDVDDVNEIINIILAH